ncbi:Sodium/hydrogen exchanger family-domain-containing protein [Desarmillaria tabescens]|uniref:Sodium/hydrogen exchanger family-domain-containing protein n=1 Tax=Armillaria tabescens TaxID=1929756 RepID=A0AA39TYY8_ARMTA|nr:Sodium/hydrogen exchanger family-domain-containing protein [Desarmillaria tabescens]KAK0467114.1 Sodium/hydrogen exchanger family-domain-containing protein [Desarmillaria tabescens]
MPEFSSTAITLFSKRAAQEQGGLLSGKDPTEVNINDPIRLWIIQVGVIVATASLLSLGLRKIRQPKVIAEVLGGILLGPTAFGRIPGFTEHIFPTDSQPYLSLVANIGLCLFLFLVGLEIDAGVVIRNARLSASIGLAGMVLPFGLGAALSYPVYKQFITEDVAFTHFMLFSGVAFSITAFPVLCRILTELKLLDTTVGIVVLSAGVANDIVGWTLLALSVALVNAGSGLTALWILMACVGWTLFLLLGVKRAMAWLARKTGSIENGPTMFFMTVTILLVFGSAFFTDIIGVHAIFGAFLAGIIVPREGNLAIRLTEKLEDMVSIIFLPLYFTLSGLSTDLGLLNNGITWAYTVGIILLAFIGKFGGCTLSARFAAGFGWRESGAIGSLMSCKGLVELIVLNVGLSAGILTQRVFSMFVLEALTLTFATTPLVTFFYPQECRVRVAATGANFNNVSGGLEEGGSSRTSRASEAGLSKTRFTVVLDKLEHVPGMMVMAQLIQPSIHAISTSDNNASGTKKSMMKLKSAGPSIEALRLIELSDRTSAVMKSSAAESILLSDPLLSIFKMFGQLNDLVISTALSIVPYDDLSQSVADNARDSGSEMIMLPWLSPSTSHDSYLLENMVTTKSPPNNPFESLFRTNAPTDQSAVIHSHFVRGVFAHSKTDVALFVDLSTPGMPIGSSHHIFLPFFGGPDDRLALDFVAQLCENPKTTATIVRVTKRDVEVPMAFVEAAHLGNEKGAVERTELTITSVANTFPDTVYGHATTETRMQSETADNIIWARYASPSETSVYPTQEALKRMKFRELSSPIPLHAILAAANEEIEVMKGKRMLTLIGRSRRLAVENHAKEIKELMDEHGHVGPEVKKTIGDVATSFVLSRCVSGVIVVQAAAIQD